jgi:hypothetical protein
VSSLVESLDLDADVDGAPLKFRTLGDLLRPALPPGFIDRELTE